MSFLASMSGNCPTCEAAEARQEAVTSGSAAVARQERAAAAAAAALRLANDNRRRFREQMIAKEWCPGGNLAALRLHSLGLPVTKSAVIALAPQFVPKPRRR